MHYKKLILAVSVAGLLIPGKVLADSAPEMIETISTIASPSEIPLASPSEIASYSSIPITPSEEEETTVMLPGAERKGFIFDHWNTEKDDYGDTYYEGDVVDLHLVSDLYAFWEIDPEYVASDSEIPKVATPSEMKHLDEDFLYDVANEKSVDVKHESESLSENEAEKKTASVAEDMTTDDTSSADGEKKSTIKEVSEEITEAIENVEEKVASILQKDEVTDESH